MEKSRKEGTVSAVTPRFQVTLNRALGLLTFTMFRTGQISYEYSISLLECRKQPKILEVIREWVELYHIY